MHFVEHALKSTVTVNDLNKMFKKLSLKYHPDKNGDAEIMKIINIVNSKHKEDISKGFISSSKCMICPVMKSSSYKICNNHVCITCNGVANDFKKHDTYCYTCLPKSICSVCKKLSEDPLCFSCKCMLCDKQSLDNSAFCSIHKCMLCDKIIYKNGKYCEVHTPLCTVIGCMNPAQDDMCYQHKCKVIGCLTQTYGNCKYCSDHICTTGGCIRLKVNDTSCDKHKVKQQYVCSYVMVRGKNIGKQCTIHVKNENDLCSRHKKT